MWHGRCQRSEASSDWSWTISWGLLYLACPTQNSPLLFQRGTISQSTTTTLGLTHPPPTRFQSETKIGLTTPLVLYLPFKFLVTTLCVSLPLPVGLFTPTFVTGGAIGRIFGEALDTLGVQVKGVSTFAPWEYAVIGAAAFSSGVTRAISTAVIVFELSGQNHLRLPMSVAILAAYFTGNRFTKVGGSRAFGSLNKSPWVSVGWGAESSSLVSLPFFNTTGCVQCHP